MLDLKRIFTRLNAQRKSLRNIGFDPRYLLLPLSFSFIATFLEGVTITALIPFVKGVISRNFQFLKELPVLDKIIGFLSPFITFSNSGLFIFLLCIILFSGILKNVFAYLSQIAVSYQIRKFSANLRNIIFDRYIRFGKMFFDRHNIGHLGNILSNFSYQIGQQFSTLNNAMNQILMFFLYLILMFLISWRITIFVIIILPFFNLVFRKLIKKIADTSNNYAQSSNIFSAKLFNIQSCITLVKLYNNEENEKRNFNDYNLQLRRVEFSSDRNFYLLRPLQEVMFLVAMLFLVVLMSYFYAIQKTGELASYMVYFYLLRRTQQTVGCFNDLKAVFAMIKGPISSVFDILTEKDKFFVPQGDRHFDGLKNKIEFNHLNFYYFKERQVLFDVSFSVEKGKMVAIVGSTGSGKTTMVNLLLRLYDCPPGSILIDGTDIRSLTTKSLLEHFGYVSQETFLFNDTLKNNIAYALKPPPTEEAIMEVIKQARLFDFIASLPGGLDTYIGDRGVQLSGGEKQRVAIARTMLKGAEILILDEATSSLDTKTERLIQEAIDEAVKDKTVIVIAHRLSTIKNADKIIVIEEGRFIEEGSLEYLIEKRGKFYEYWQEQKFF